MDRLSLLLENSKRAIRYWWLLLLVGVILIVAGISVFLYPVQSYLGLSVLFGWLMLVSGVLEAVLASSNRHFVTGRGWMLVGGIIEIILGIILIMFPYRPSPCRSFSDSGCCCAGSGRSDSAAT